MGLTRIDAYALTLIVVSVAGLIVTYNNLQSDSEACLNNPLIYGAASLQEANGADVSCSCSVQKPNSPTLYFDNDSQRLEGLLGDEEYPVINFSGFVIKD